MLFAAFEFFSIYMLELVQFCTVSTFGASRFHFLNAGVVLFFAGRSY